MKETNKKTKATPWEKNIYKSQVWHKTYIQKNVFLEMVSITSPIHVQCVQCDFEILLRGGVSHSSTRMWVDLWLDIDL